MSTSAPSDSSAASGYAPFAQLIKMLLPSARSVALYDALAELVWCSDGFEPLDLRVLLDQQRASDTLASRGNVETTSGGVPVFIAALRGAGRAAARLARHRARRRQLAQHSVDGREHAASRARLPREQARPRAQHARRRSKRRARSPARAPRARSRGSERAAAAPRPLREGASVPDGRVARAGQESRALVDLRRVVRQSSQLVGRTQKHLLAWAQAQQSRHGRESRRAPARRTRSFRARFTIRTAACSGSSRCFDPRMRKTSSRATSGSSSSWAARPLRFSTASTTR